MPLGSFPFRVGKLAFVTFSYVKEDYLHLPAIRLDLGQEWPGKMVDYDRGLTIEQQVEGYLQGAGFEVLSVDRAHGALVCFDRANIHKMWDSVGSAWAKLKEV